MLSMFLGVKKLQFCWSHFAGRSGACEVALCLAKLLLRPGKLCASTGSSCRGQSQSSTSGWVAENGEENLHGSTVDW